MLNRRAFTIWLTCLGVIFHLAQSALVIRNQNMTENCRRLVNELDDNEIVTQQKVCNSRSTLQDYYRDRKDLLNYEVEASFGADIKLTENEELANKIIMQAKEDEFRTGFLRPFLFNPARHIFEVLDVIKQSKLFQIIQKMPKGGILHAHDMALCSANYVVSLTYWPNLWQRTSSKSNQIEEFVFSRDQPKNPDINQNDNSDSTWCLVEDARNEMGASNYDEHIRTLFTLFDKNINPRIQFSDINEVWKRLMGIFGKVAPILTYAPAWKEYYKNALKEMLDDGVQYLEFRGILPQVPIFVVINSITQNKLLNLNNSSIVLYECFPCYIESHFNFETYFGMVANMVYFFLVFFSLALF